MKKCCVFHTEIMMSAAHMLGGMLPMGALRGEQEGAVAPPWKIKKKKFERKKCTNKILTCKRPPSYVMRGNCEEISSQKAPMLRVKYS